VFFWSTGAYEQARGERELANLLVEGPAPDFAPPLEEGSLVGRIRSPQQGWAAVIFEGTGESVLRKGVGHVSGSALPQDPGNVVLAAHRDTFFRELKDVKVGDVLVMDTPAGEFQYEVLTASVVPPDAVEVLKQTSFPTLTLITCYPFSYVGSAPKRFVVHASRE
jgi:sortase A